MKRTDAAVSPVVGVMLMLAVTVMIAAIVSTAAGGLSENKKKAPGAILDVTFFAEKSYGDCRLPSMVIKHVSGEVLPTRDLQIILYYRTPAGNLVKGNLTGQHSVSMSSQYSGVLFISDESREGFSMDETLQDSPRGYANWFGNASAAFRPGDIMVTPAQFCTNPADKHNPGMEYLFPGVDFEDHEFPAGSVVTVRIIHIPSGQLIFDKDVIVS